MARFIIFRPQTILNLVVVGALLAQLNFILNAATADEIIDADAENMLQQKDSPHAHRSPLSIMPGTPPSRQRFFSKEHCRADFFALCAPNVTTSTSVFDKKKQQKGGRVNAQRAQGQRAFPIAQGEEHNLFPLQEDATNNNKKKAENDPNTHRSASLRRFAECLSQHSDEIKDPHCSAYIGGYSNCISAAQEIAFTTCTKYVPPLKNIAKYANGENAAKKLRNHWLEQCIGRAPKSSFPAECTGTSYYDELFRRNAAKRKFGNGEGDTKKKAMKKEQQKAMKKTTKPQTDE